MAVIRTTLGARARTAADASARSSGGVVGGAGPAICGNGSTRASARSTVRGGASSFSRRRIVDCCTSARSFVWPGSCSSDGAGDPDEREPERGAGDQAADRVEQPQRRDHRQTAARERTGDAGDRLEQRGADQRADEPGERRVGRAGAAVQQVRAQAGADDRAGRRARRSESAVAISPRRRPASAASAAIASAIQSTRVTQAPSYRESAATACRYTAPRSGA